MDIRTPALWTRVSGEAHYYTVDKICFNLEVSSCFDVIAQNCGIFRGGMKKCFSIAELEAFLCDCLATRGLLIGLISSAVFLDFLTLTFRINLFVTSAYIVLCLEDLQFLLKPPNCPCPCCCRGT